MYNQLVKHIFFPLVQHAFGRRQIANTLYQLERAQWYNSAEIKELQLAKLRSLVDYAYRRIPYYRNKFEETGVRPSDINSLEDVGKLPVLQKSDIKENLSLMVAPDFRGKLTKNTTSGSTGHPIVFYEDGRKHMDALTEYLRFLRWYGVDIGAKEARFVRLTSEMCRGNKRNLAAKIFLNRLILPGMAVSERDFEDCFEKMDNFKPRVLFGITSTLFMFTQHALQRKKSLRNIQPDLVVAWAAPLYPYQRNLMEATYNCPVASLYGAREVGHLAAECPEKSFHINEENLLVEVVNSGNPCRAGEQGSILVTTLNHYCMPFIRYDVGDVAILDDASCSCGRGLGILREIVGRSGEILTTPSGKILSPNFWCRMMMSDRVAGCIKQFKVIQKTKADISIQIVRDHGYTDEHTSFLRALLASNLGDDTNIDFEFVESIPPEKSGKYRLVVSELPE